jgi:hypothetical protein
MVSTRACGALSSSSNLDRHTEFEKTPKGVFSCAYRDSNGKGVGKTGLVFPWRKNGNLSGFQTEMSDSE